MIRCNTLRRMLRKLWENDEAPKLDEAVPRLKSIRPRCVTASRSEIELLLDNASKTLRLFLLLCSDEAIRSGTAVRLGPQHYITETRRLEFTTKYNEKVSVPVTDDVAELLAECNLSSVKPFLTQLRIAQFPNANKQRTSPFVSGHQLRKELTKLRAQLGIEKRIIPHDLRRTTAVALYRRTRDIRKVQALLGHHQLQSTFWYLDHELEPVDLADLEATKQPFIIRRKTA